MSLEYLISQLPSLDGAVDGAPLPITWEEFDALCSEFLGKRAQDLLEKVTLAPNKDEERLKSPLIDAWNKGERSLRLALAKVRAEKLKKQTDVENLDIGAETAKFVEIVIAQENPLKAEKALDDYRLSFLETIRPIDSFSEEFIFYYALRFKLLSRRRSFDDGKGEVAYQNFYQSIIRGERAEEKQ